MLVHCVDAARKCAQTGDWPLVCGQVEVVHGLIPSLYFFQSEPLRFRFQTFAAGGGLVRGRGYLFGSYTLCLWPAFARYAPGFVLVLYAGGRNEYE